MSRIHQKKDPLSNRKVIVMTAGTNKQRIVGSVLRKTAKWRRALMLPALESFLRKKEASYKQMIISGFWEIDRRGFYNAGRYTDRNCNQRYKRPPFESIQQKSRVYRYATSVSDDTAPAESQPGGKKLFS